MLVIGTRELMKPGLGTREKQLVRKGRQVRKEKPKAERVEGWVERIEPR
jgi:hypothetical protein